MEKCARKAQPGKTCLLRGALEVMAVVAVQMNIDRDLLMPGSRCATDGCIPEIASVTGRDDQRGTHRRPKRLKPVEEYRVMPVLSPAKPSGTSTGEFWNGKMRPAPSTLERFIRGAWDREQHGRSLGQMLQVSD